MSEHTSPERFMPFPISDGMLQDLRSDRFPTFVHGWQEADLSMGAHGTHFGFVYDGSARLRTL